VKDHRFTHLNHIVEEDEDVFILVVMFNMTKINDMNVNNNKLDQNEKNI